MGFCLIENKDKLQVQVCTHCQVHVFSVKVKQKLLVLRNLGVHKII
jgi:hypothetical protein